MTTGKRNRQAGHNWERELAEAFRELGFNHVVTSRSESRSRDNDKVDLINRNERINGQFAFNVQAKNATKHLKYAKILGELPVNDGVLNVILHKQTEKVGERFVPQGKFAILPFNDFMALLLVLKKAGILLTPDVVTQARA